MASSSGHPEITTRVTTRMTSERDMEKCTGLTGVFIRESGIMVFNTEQALCSFLMGLL